jgi:hypothetical protein
MLDGVYVKRNGTSVFYSLPDPTEHDVNWIATTSWKRIEKILKKHGRLPDDDTAYDALGDEQPVLAHCYSQSTHGDGALRVLTDIANAKSSSTSTPTQCRRPGQKTLGTPRQVHRKAPDRPG